jgi:ABC-2 type transport system ATP-binding protein
VAALIILDPPGSRISLYYSVDALRRQNSKIAHLMADGWTLAGNTSIASGNPTEPGPGISGQDAGNRLPGSFRPFRQLNQQFVGFPNQYSNASVTLRRKYMSQQNAISVRGLRKNYGDIEAVKGIDFEVRTGEVFGLLGPNGAGKTTTVEILEGIRQRSGGEVLVLGLDPDKQKKHLKDRIGVCLQQTNLPDKIKVIEALELFGALYSRMLNPDDLLQRLQLVEKREAYYSTLSGGQKQRLAIALGMINDPSLLFLDEPTQGLDPQVRLEIHSLIEGMKAEKRTILMTTHYIEEAERLCDRVAIVDAGQIIAIGTPRELMDRSAGKSTIGIVCEQPLDAGTMPAWSDATGSSLSEDRRHLTVTSRRPARTLVEIVKWVDSQGFGLEDVQLKRPTLEDVFIELTGKRLRD